MNKITGTFSLIIALFLLVSMLMQVDTLLMGGIAIVALVALAAYQFTRKGPAAP